MINEKGHIKDIVFIIIVMAFIPIFFIVVNAVADNRRLIKENNKLKKQVETYQTLIDYLQNGSDENVKD